MVTGSTSPLVESDAIRTQEGRTVFVWITKPLTIRSAESNSANHMVFEAIKLIRWCVRNNICGYLENPWTSMIWKVPALQRLIQQGLAFLIRADQCQYSRQFRTPTGLLIWGCSPFVMKTCGHGPLCTRTNKRHILLTGIRHGKFMTHAAQVYSTDFAAALISSLALHRFPP